MSNNFNIGNFLTNFANGMLRGMQESVRQPQVNEAELLYSQNSEIAQQPKPQTPTLFQGTMNQLSQTAAELAELNQKQTSQMLKELLNMPKDMEQVLAQLSRNSSMTNLKTAMFLLSSTLDIMKLSSMLQQSSKDASTNLYKMMAQFNQLGLSLKDEQIAQITKMISIVASSSTSDVQSMKTLMLLYLPWLPLTNPDALKWEISGSKGSDGADGTDSITVLIATENYGNLQAILTKTEEDGIRAEIISSKTFPRELLIEKMKEESKKYSVNINCLTQAKSEFDKDNSKPSKTQVCMNSSPGVNPFLILISSALIKHVHDIDNLEKLREERREKIG